MSSKEVITFNNDINKVIIIKNLIAQAETMIKSIKNEQIKNKCLSLINNE